MIETNFRADLEVGLPEYEGVGHLKTPEVAGQNLEVFQREMKWELEERQKQIESHLRHHGIEIDTKAIHERIEKIMGMDKDALDTLEKAVKAKLEQKKKEMDVIVKSL